MIIAKLNNQLFQVIKVADTVQFSDQRGWVLITPDVNVPNWKKQQFKWVPAATTHFDWVRQFNFDTMQV